MQKNFSHACALLQTHFVNDAEFIAVAQPNGKPSPAMCLDFLALLKTHVCGIAARPVEVAFFSNGKLVASRVGRFRIGFYHIDRHGNSRSACIDIDVGGQHKFSLKDPVGVAKRILAKAKSLGLPAYLERSGGGNGFHIWIFFDAPISAALARRLGLALVPDDALLVNGELANARANRGLEVFPKQEWLAPGQLGNLVWAPFWGGAAPGGNQFYHPYDDGKARLYIPAGFDTVSEERVRAILGSLAPGCASPGRSLPARNSPANRSGQRHSTVMKGGTFSDMHAVTRAGCAAYTELLDRLTSGGGLNRDERIRIVQLAMGVGMEPIEIVDLFRPRKDFREGITRAAVEALYAEFRRPACSGMAAIGLCNGRCPAISFTRSTSPLGLVAWNIDGGTHMK